MVSVLSEGENVKCLFQAGLPPIFENSHLFLGWRGYFYIKQRREILSNSKQNARYSLKITLGFQILEKTLKCFMGGSFQDYS